MLAACGSYGLSGISPDQLAITRQIDGQDVEIQIIAKVVFTQVSDVGVAFADSFHTRGHILGTVKLAVDQGHGLDTLVIFYCDRKWFFTVSGSGWMIKHSWCLFVIQQSGLMFVLSVGRCGNAEYGEQGREYDCRE